VIHLYAVTGEAPQELDEVTGIEDTAVTSVRCDDLHAVVSEHAHPPATTQHNALVHAHVVGVASRRQAAVPIRFGVDHADVAALRGAIAGAAPTLRTTLARVGDAVEFVVRSATPAPGPAAVTVPGGDVPDRGRSYLEARLADQRAAADARSRATSTLVAASSGLDDLARTTLTTDGHAGPERCFLVPRAQVDDFVATASVLIEDRDDLVFGGPWPPYTFARDTWGEGGQR
jgi:hypothetical protein